MFWGVRLYGGAGAISAERAFSCTDMYGGVWLYGGAGAISTEPGFSCTLCTLVYGHVRPLKYDFD
jgi:hypothetical protein